MPEMKCPICGLALDVDEIYDDTFDAEKREENWYGHCPKCRKEYHWTHIFVYKNTVDFGEVKEDEKNRPSFILDVKHLISKSFQSHPS